MCTCPPYGKNSRAVRKCSSTKLKLFFYLHHILHVKLFYLNVLRNLWLRTQILMYNQIDYLGMIKHNPLSLLFSCSFLNGFFSSYFLLLCAGLVCFSCWGAPFCLLVLVGCNLKLLIALSGDIIKMNAAGSESGTQDYPDMTGPVGTMIGIDCDPPSPKTNCCGCFYGRS